MNSDSLEDFEIRILLDIMQQRFGYDFRQYADASLRRQILHCLEVFQCQSIASLIPRLLHENGFLEHLVHEMTVGVTAMFRDPTIYHALRQHVLPDLMTYAFINVWHAGCSTGEEAYSMAIFLQEEGLYDRARIYATDLDIRAIHAAREGSYSLNRIDEYNDNYNKAGGRWDLKDYYRAENGVMQIHASLKKNMVFATHNLATDHLFADMHLIFCRNVLIYFAQPLQNRVLSLFRESLVRGGVLCLGNQESLQFSNEEAHFTVVTHDEAIYQKRSLPG